MTAGKEDPITFSGNFDTFHEVRRRRDRKKEGSSSRVSEESRSRQHGQGRGARGAQGAIPQTFLMVAAGGTLLIEEKMESIILQRELMFPLHRQIYRKYLIHHLKPQGVQLLHPIVLQIHPMRTANDTVNQENIQPQAVVAVVATISPNETVGSITRTDQGKSSSSDQGKSLSSSDQHPVSVSSVYSSSDSMLVPSIAQNPGVGGAISREVGNDLISTGPNHVKGNKLEEAGDLSASEKEKSMSMISTSNPNALQKSNEVESNQLSEPLQLSSSLSLNSSLRPPQDVSETANVPEVSASEAHVQSTELRPLVTFPNHFQVPEALKSGLTFGNFDNFGTSERSYSVTGCDNSTSSTPETSPGNDEAVTSSNQSVPLIEHGGHVDYAHSSSYLVTTTLASEGISVTDNDSKIEQPKQEVLLTPEGHPILTVQSAQNYGLNLMSTMLGTQQVQFDGSELQAQETSHLPSLVQIEEESVNGKLENRGNNSGWSCVALRRAVGEESKSKNDFTEEDGEMLS
ncbi:unnamed protein product [Vicia faba]|uniref:Uncharacterized protein n=1 Tax=Vicia faba TaxID=3906 RepID=A0AAV0YSJ6_VICFA|nr:unnamed protein product [Vicia faba]